MQAPPTLAPGQPTVLPDHKQLPESDGSIVENFQEHPQSNLLSDCLLPRYTNCISTGSSASAATAASTGDSPSRS